MPLRVNDNDLVRQNALQELLEPYISTQRVSMFHEELTQYDLIRGCHNSVVAQQIRQYLATDMVIVYGETPFEKIVDVDWYRRYQRHRNFYYIASNSIEIPRIVHAVLIQLYFVTNDSVEKEYIAAGLWRCSHLPESGS
ncbi:hypothetical protein COS66_00785 [Candidatus Berkelbacteria bacterium CG06_land_8_20_14_3_00_43_10]|uniref:Uncharacterized protein n=1 Tax=Candidatus Berkelbacteria bacterium CG10_big_fil_rev_8_21_14_0_10_43_14 TaxID=1974515 RepID=A0A2M6R9K7_9BACT|nr:MAG: hypothetical protein AUK41_02375 [Candidatus Berkelbacteria bacterium CG2_30_43_20]PIS07199.1 MAG: hypothetical protein COT79_00565 [Candidatus Berkelbacteria bacterium CG10_big_fil_rev_8_21_14_0_10_43_14]PIU87453.1 MAG: hypothetical protein COS66_00785 [Candidatus Berkelbacteria bacterium CG06_land_8_20_14_3_00_43_10]